MTNTPSSIENKKLKKTLRPLMLAGFILAGVGTSPTYATDLNLAFSFGPGFSSGGLFFFPSSSSTRNLTVPGHTVVSVSGTLNPLPSSLTVPLVPVVIEVIRPEGGVAAPINSAAVQLGSVSFAFLFPPTFISDVGCPRSWKVRVRTANGAVPPLTVSGTISYHFFVPGNGGLNPLPSTYNLNMLGGGVHLEGGQFTAVPLAAHDPVFFSDNFSLIEGSEGMFRINAKWDTAPDICYLGRIFKLHVGLLKPGGTTVADEETALSQTTSTSENDKVNFGYTVTPADAMLAGHWNVRVADNNSVPCCTPFCSGTRPVAIDNFDIENFIFPAFQSTFTPHCSEAVGSFDVTPENAVVAVGEKLNYAFTWTVPEGLNWHDLQFLEFRMRDGADTILTVRFEEATKTFSLLNQAADKFQGSFTGGSSHRLQTSEATLDLSQSSAVASGPTSTTVTLNLALSFKPRASGRTFDVEVAASDDEGGEPQFFDQAGTLTVTPLH